MVATPADATPEDCATQTDTPLDSAPMRFTILERPNQAPVLLAEGMIDSDLMPRLRAALDGFQGREIWLRSSSGTAGIDHQAGMLIRSRRLRTRVPAGWLCRGACNFMFMGGSERIVEPGGRFVVHMFSSGGDAGDLNEVERSARLLATVDYDFLIRMGVSPRLLPDIMYREPAGGGRCLTRAELDEYRVTTNAALPRRGGRL